MKKTGYIADRTIFQNLRKRLNKIAKNSVLQANVGENLPGCYSDLMSGIDWDSFNANVNSFVGAITKNGPQIIALISGIGAGFVAWNVISMIQGVITAIHAFKTANDGLKISQIALNAVMSANPLALVAALIAGVVTAVFALWNTSEEFRNAWYKLWEGIKTTTRDTINGIVSSFEGMVNSMIRGLNWLIEQANKIQISIPDWVPGIGGKTWGVNIKPLNEIKLPRLAQGAVIPPNREFMAVLGDQKSGTNIETPLATMVQAFKQAMAETGGSGDTTVILEVDGQQFGKATFKAYNRESRRVGVNLVGAT